MSQAPPLLLINNISGAIINNNIVIMGTLLGKELKLIGAKYFRWFRHIESRADNNAIINSRGMTNDGGL